MNMRSGGVLVASVMVAASSCMAQGQPGQADGWKVEIAPYLWFANADADVTVRDLTVNVEADFGDIIDAADVAFSIGVEAIRPPWFVGTTFDYLSLDPDSSDTKGPPGADLELDSMLWSVGGGYIFDLPIEGALLGVGAALRFTSLEPEITVSTPAGPVSRKSDESLVDGILVLRPSFVLMDRLRFNPVVMVGAGDSDFTYDLWPNLMYRFSDSWFGRVGYRRLYFDVKKDDTAFEGSFDGAFVSVSFVL